MGARLRLLLFIALLLFTQLAIVTHSPAGGRITATLLVLSKPECFNCRLMQPILERLREQYQGRVAFSFVDVSANPEQARFFQLRKTPTLVFYDAEHREVARHAGFMDRDNIVGILEKVLAAGTGRQGGHGQ